jgi:hypothetical protein
LTSISFGEVLVERQTSRKANAMQQVSITELKVRIVKYEHAPTRTTALEQRIQIGSGFHNKWYRSQRDHMLGWMIVQECQARKTGKDPSRVNAQGMWNRLKCSPLMFWLAECSGVSDGILATAEQQAERAAGINLKDGDPHGTMMRSVLPWSEVSDCILLQPKPDWGQDDELEARDSFERLVKKNSQYRPLVHWLDR